MGDTPADVEPVAPFAVIDVVLRGGAGMVHDPIQQIDALVLFLEQRLTEDVAECQRAQRSHRIDEQRMGAVERVDVPAAVRQSRPSPRLHCTADFQRQLVEAALPLAGRDASFTHEPPQVAVGADVVEPVIVDPHVRQVRRHAIHGARSSQLEELLLARRIELQDRRPELEALRPFGPATGLIAARHREHRRTLLRPPGAFDRPNLVRRKREQPVDGRHQIGGRSATVDADHRGVIIVHSTRRRHRARRSTQNSEPAADVNGEYGGNGITQRRRETEISFVQDSSSVSVAPFLCVIPLSP